MVKVNEHLRTPAIGTNGVQGAEVKDILRIFHLEHDFRISIPVTAFVCSVVSVTNPMTHCNSLVFYSFPWTFTIILPAELPSSAFRTTIHLPRAFQVLLCICYRYHILQLLDHYYSRPHDVYIPLFFIHVLRDKVNECGSSIGPREIETLVPLPKPQSMESSRRDERPQYMPTCIILVANEEFETI